MSPQYPYALYLDSKILGTARQLISFYEQGVFSAENTIIYLKKYKESAKGFIKIFRAKGIPFQFMKPKELDALSGQTIFYAFNAQSNCRFVANRKLKHIFITHGESNKVSSIKPIIRIYDHVIMAGKLSLERYYRSGLFDEHDYETGRLIMMGDTFIGRTGFSSDKRKEQVLFYAPTWEGGLESENYSSLQNPKLVLMALKQGLVQKKLNKIIIQPHPNLGHRDSRYVSKLVALLIELKKIEGITIYLKAMKIALTPFQRLKVKYSGIEFLDNLRGFFPYLAFIDISALETQCINEDIQYYSFYKDNLLRHDIPEVYQEQYRTNGIDLDINHSDMNFDFSVKSINASKAKVINYSDLTVPSIILNNRIHLIGEFK